MSGGDVAGLIGVAGSLLFTVVIVVFSLVVTVVSVAVPLGIVFLVFRAMGQAREAEQKLIATGKAAPAKILAVGQTGLYVNEQPQVQITLEVSPPDGPPFQAQVNKIISLLAIPRVQPGQILEVRYDPANPKRLAIVGL